MFTFPPSRLRSSIVTFALVVPCIHTEEARYFVRSLTRPSDRCLKCALITLHFSCVASSKFFFHYCFSFASLLPIHVHSHLPIRSTFLGDSLSLRKHVLQDLDLLTDKYE